MSDTYLIKLRPLSHYYFGGENGLGSGDSRNYLVKSRKWPQQTSILGMVRYLLLKENNLLAAPGQSLGEKAEDLIGEHSFQLGKVGNIESDKSLKFGAIEELGPVCLEHENKVYFRSSLTQGMSINPREEDAEKEGIWYGGTNDNMFPAMIMDEYDPKEGLCYGLSYLSEKNTLVPLDLEEEEEEIKKRFIEETQIGIEKSRDGKSNEQAFYKQTYYRLGEGWSFIFYLKVKAGTKIPEQTELPFGGERCLFSLSSQSLEEKEPHWMPASLTDDKEKLDSFILMSDALVDPAILDHCHFAVIETEDFRFLKTETRTTENYAALGEDEEGKAAVSKSQKYNLLKAGSVLYPKNKGTVKGYLDKARLQNIGYNHYFEKNRGN